MYEAFYQLVSDPFRLLPDAGISFPHRSSARAWAFIRYALRRGEGIVVVTGAPGAGKTILAQRLVREISPSRTVAVQLVGSGLDTTELLRRLAYGFGLAVEGMDRARLAYAIERFLMGLEVSQRSALLVIDEAQALSHESLEALRLLTDLQSNSRPVLQLFLFGRDSLEAVLQEVGMEQFQQRVVAACRLQTMSVMESKAYIEHRLCSVGWRGDPAIDGSALLAIHRYSLGSPRHINKICGRLMLHGCIEEKHALGESDVLAVMGDLQGELLAPLGLMQTAIEVDLAAEGLTSVEDLRLEVSALTPSFASEPVKSDLDVLFEIEDETLTSDPKAPGAALTAAGNRQLYPGRRRRRRTLRGWLNRRLAGVGRSIYGLGGALVAAVGALRPQSRSSWQHGIRTGIGRSFERVRGTLASLMSGNGFSGVGSLTPVPMPLVLALPVVAISGLIWMFAGGGLDRTGRDAVVFDLDENSLVTAEGGIAVLEATTRYLDSDMGFVWSIPGGGTHSFERINSVIKRPAGPSGAVSVSNEPLMDDVQLAEIHRQAEGGVLAQVTGQTGQGVLGTLLRSSRTLDLLLVNLRGQQETAGSAANLDVGDDGRSGEEQQVVVVVGSGEKTAADFVQLLPATGAGVKRTTVVVPGPFVAQAASPSQVETVSSEPAGGTELVIAAEHQGEPLTTASVSIEAAPLQVQTVASDPTAGWMEEAEKALAANRLMLPPDRSAVSYYRRVLHLDPSHAAAQAGMKRVVGKYLVLGDAALAVQDFAKADRYILRARRVLPADHRVDAFASRVAVAKASAAEAEALQVARAEQLAAERARMAARQLELQRAAAVARKPGDDSFQELMQMID